MHQYVFLILSLGLLAVWSVIFSMKVTFRKEMLWVSFLTMFLGLTEPFFVPEYWNPPTWLNLAQKTGFDLESFIFTFAIGGLAVSVYEMVFKTKHQKIPVSRRKKRFHLSAIIFAALTFLILYFSTTLNPIYSASIAMLVGFIFTLSCRPDLFLKMLISGSVFLGIYFISLTIINFNFPNYIGSVWNTVNLSGIYLSGLPIEELIWAFSFGLFWSSIYEHLNNYQLKTI
ncbi:MAG TPA: lycopene cyclase domain-containing protein [Patescibacteria group bacterium]